MPLERRRALTLPQLSCKITAHRCFGLQTTPPGRCRRHSARCGKTFRQEHGHPGRKRGRITKVYFDNGPQTQQRAGRQPANGLHVAIKRHRQLEVNAPRRAIYNGETPIAAENEVKEPGLRNFTAIPYWTGLWRVPCVLQDHLRAPITAL